jgi:hypothetical protein
MVQLVGSPVPVAMNPKLVVAPGVRVPFQDRLVAVTRCPEVLISASQ